MSVAPTLIAINPDEYHAEHVGRAADGRQFFLTTPFVPAMRDDPGREFVALYIFDANGSLVESHIEDLGIRCQIEPDTSNPYPNKYLAPLGKYRLERIEIQPFQIEKFGIEFGLIPQPPEDEEDFWCAELHPGNYMAFYEPFDSGDYDT